MTKIFISYRREDAGFAVDQVYEALKPYAARPDDIFVDVDNIPPGVDFVEHLNKYVDQCDVMLVAIGPNWLTAHAESIKVRRLDDPEDFVRIEITSALSRSIPVVPLLLGGAKIPREDQLPEDLRPLVRRQAVDVPRGGVQPAIDRMMHGLGFEGAQQKSGGVPGWLAPLMAVIVLAAGGFGLWQSGVLDQYIDGAPIEETVASAELEDAQPGGILVPDLVEIADAPGFGVDPDGDVPGAAVDFAELLEQPSTEIDPGIAAKFGPEPAIAGKHGPIKPVEPAVDAAKRKELIRRLQTALTELDYYSGAADGIVGPGTSKATAQFQGTTGHKAPMLKTDSLGMIEVFVSKAEREVANEREAVRQKQIQQEEADERKRLADIDAQRRREAATAEAERQATLNGPWDDVTDREWSILGDSELVFRFQSPQGFRNIKNAADAGNANAAVIAGLTYYGAKGGPTIDSVAAQYFKKACDGENMRGCLALGWQYQQGQGIKKSGEMAFRLYSKACFGQNIMGCNNLGFAYGNGVGVPKDYGEALKLYRQACADGYALSCYNAGELFHDGLGVVKNTDEAARFYKLACDLGDRDAC